MIYKIIYIALGGAIGSVSRFFISFILNNFFAFFPIGTLFINVSGSFVIGLLATYLSYKGTSEVVIKYFIIIGILGSFTTFSTFAIEFLELFKEGKLYSSIIYIFLSVLLSILAAYVGLTYFKFWALD